MKRLWSQWVPHRAVSEIAAAAVAVDTVRSRRELVIENAMLRHQVNVLVTVRPFGADSGAAARRPA